MDSRSSALQDFWANFAYFLPNFGEIWLKISEIWLNSSSQNFPGLMTYPYPTVVGSGIFLGVLLCLLTENGPWD